MIPGAVQIDFDGSEYGYTKHERPFARVRYGADGPVEVNDRRLPGCQDPSSLLAIDGVVTDFIADIAEDGPYRRAPTDGIPRRRHSREVLQQMQSQASECNDFGGREADVVRALRLHLLDRFVAGLSRYDDRDYRRAI